MVWSSPVSKGTSFVTSAVPSASRNGPVGLSATATPIAPPSTTPWSTATYQKNVPSRSTTAPALAPPPAHPNRPTSSNGPCGCQLSMSFDEKQSQSRMT